MSRSGWLWVALIGGFVLFGGVALSPSPIIKAVAEAIATAEGFYVPGSRPSRNNNPGDIEADLINRAVAWDGLFPIYSSASDGWQNLYTQVAAMVNGTSKHYSPDMTIAEIGAVYAEGDPNWSHNVAAKLRVSVDTPLNQVTV